MTFTDRYKLEKAGYDGHGRIFLGRETSVSSMPCVEIQRPDLLDDWLASGEWEPSDNQPLPTIIVPASWARRVV